jgi:hypothetical protein
MPFTREASDRNNGMYSTLFVWITIF